MGRNYAEAPNENKRGVFPLDSIYYRGSITGVI
jgi:hypothetical protein